MPLGSAPNPIREFKRWFAAARRSGLPHPDAMCLSTMGSKGFPDARFVLLKGIDSGGPIDPGATPGPLGFVFYTNLRSAKGAQLRTESRCALTFYWDRLERQVRIQGVARRVTDAEADSYFATRPRMSQLAAWASDQSAVLASRAVLERRMARFSRLYRGKKVPRPSHWHGFRAIPRRIEFWRGRAYRLHDRILYVRRGHRWWVRRLYP